MLKPLLKSTVKISSKNYSGHAFKPLRYESKFEIPQV